MAAKQYTLYGTRKHKKDIIHIYSLRVHILLNIQ